MCNHQPMIQTTTSPLLTPSRIYYIYIYTHDFWINFSSLEQFSQKRWATGHPTCISHVGRSSWQRVLMGDSCSERPWASGLSFFWWNCLLSVLWYFESQYLYQTSVKKGEKNCNCFHSKQCNHQTTSQKDNQLTTIGNVSTRKSIETQIWS